MTFRIPLPTTAQAFARGTMIGSTVFNAGLFVFDLWRHEYHLAALQSIMVGALAAYLVLRPKFDRRLDALVEDAVNRQRMSGRALEEMERHIRASSVEVRVSAERRH